MGHGRAYVHGFKGGSGLQELKAFGSCKKKLSHAQVGPVGSGKSSLLLALLGELEGIKGTGGGSVGGRVAYAAQEAWILTGRAS